MTMNNFVRKKMEVRRSLEKHFQLHKGGAKVRSSYMGWLMHQFFIPASHFFSCMLLLLLLFILYSSLHKLFLVLSYYYPIPTAYCNASTSRHPKKNNLYIIIIIIMI